MEKRQNLKKTESVERKLFRKNKVLYKRLRVKYEISKWKKSEIMTADEESGIVANNKQLNKMVK